MAQSGMSVQEMRKVMTGFNHQMKDGVSDASREQLKRQMNSLPDATAQGGGRGRGGGGGGGRGGGGGPQPRLGAARWAAAAARPPRPETAMQYSTVVSQ